MVEDALYKFLGWYYASPPFIKNIAGRSYRLLPLRVRYGSVYVHFKKLLEKSQYWSPEEIHQYQTEKFIKLVCHCLDHVPYYQKLFAEHNLNRSDFKTLEDIQKIPFLTKENILNHKEDLVATNYPKSRLMYYSTGGTTGTPMSFYNEKGVSRSKELAFMTAQWMRVGYRIHDPVVTLRGNVIPSSKNNQFWEYEPIKNRLVFSTYHMTDENLEQYVRQIRNFKPKFIHTYPSAVTILAKFMKERSLEPFETVKAVFCSSEAFYPGQRELLESVFRCRIFSWYGLGEMVALAGECERSTNYHIFPEYGIFELIDANGSVIEKEGQLGEIVGTGLDRDIMPFIRYRTGDYAEYLDQPCACGRNYRLLKRVEGRWHQEQVVTRKGNLISMTALNMHTPVFENVRQYQFEQTEKGRVTLKLVPKAGFTEKDYAAITKALMSKLDSDNIELTLRLVDASEIETGRSGKFRFLIQKLNIN